MTLDAAAMKKIVAEEAVNRYVKDGMNVGLGTGSTAYYAIKRIGELVAEGYDLTCVATSVQSEELAKAYCSHDHSAKYEKIRLYDYQHWEERPKIEKRIS